MRPEVPSPSRDRMEVIIGLRRPRQSLNLMQSAETVAQCYHDPWANRQAQVEFMNKELMSLREHGTYREWSQGQLVTKTYVHSVWFCGAIMCLFASSVYVSCLHFSASSVHVLLLQLSSNYIFTVNACCAACVCCSVIRLGVVAVAPCSAVLCTNGFPATCSLLVVTPYPCVASLHVFD